MSDETAESPNGEPQEQAEPTAETSIDIAVDPDRVWHALITDGGLGPWMGEGASIDPRDGGSLWLPDPVGGRPRRGLVDRIDQHQRLDFAWWPEHRPIERSRVSIVLTPIETGTRVTVTETVPPSLLRAASLSLPRTPSATAPSALLALGRPTTGPLGSAATVVGSPGHRSAAAPSAVARSMVGAWSWRLALLTVACRAALV